MEWALDKRDEWRKLIHSIEVAQRKRDSKEFFRLVKKATQIKKSGMPLEGILVG